MSHEPSDSSRPVAPRPRQDKSPPESVHSCDSSCHCCDSSWPPVLVRLPNLEQVTNDPPPLPESEEATAAPTAAPIDSEAKEDSHVHSPSDAVTSDAVTSDAVTSVVPDATSESVTRETHRTEQPVAGSRNEWSDRPSAVDVDWRSPAYKLGGTLVAAVLIVIVLLALNGGNDDSSPPPVDPSMGTQELAVTPTATLPDAEDTMPLDVDSARPTIDSGPSIDESWLAENLSSPNQSDEIQSPNSVDEGDREVQIGQDSYSLTANSSTSEPSAEPEYQVAQAPARDSMSQYELTPSHEPAARHAPASSYESTPRYEQTASSAWGEPTETHSRARLSISPETPTIGSRQAEPSAQWPSRSTNENLSVTAGYPGQQLPERFQRNSYPTAGSTQLSADTRRQPSRDVVGEQNYPSTPHVAMFDNDRQASNNGTYNTPPVRTADREAQGYGRPTPQQTDTNRAPARLQGRIEPYETGSHEHYR